TEHAAGRGGEAPAGPRVGQVGARHVALAVGAVHLLVQGDVGAGAGVVVGADVEPGLAALEEVQVDGIGDDEAALVNRGGAAALEEDGDDLLAAAEGELEGHLDGQGGAQVGDGPGWNLGADPGAGAGVLAGVGQDDADAGAVPG